MTRVTSVVWPGPGEMKCLGRRSDEFQQRPHGVEYVGFNEPGIESGSREETGRGC